MTNIAKIFTVAVKIFAMLVIGTLLCLLGYRPFGRESKPNDR